MLLHMIYLVGPLFIGKNTYMRLNFSLMLLDFSLSTERVMDHWELVIRPVGELSAITNELV